MMNSAIVYSQTSCKVFLYLAIWRMRKIKLYFIFRIPTPIVLPLEKSEPEMDCSTIMMMARITKSKVADKHALNISLD